MTMYQKLIVILLIFACVGFAGSLNFSSPTPDNGSAVGNNSVELNLSITQSNLANFTWNWNGTNHTCYNNSLVLIYGFDNLSALNENNNNVTDLSNYSHHGQVIGPVWNISGKYGGAFTFDGVNDLIETPKSSSLEIQNMTIEAWIYLDPSPNTRNTIVSYGWGSTSGGSEDLSGESYSLTYHADIETFRLRLKNSAGANIIDLLDSGSMPLANVSGWTFVTATWNGTAGKIYRNGVVVNSGTGSGTISYVDGSGVKLRVGNWFGNNERWFKGSIDEPKIYNKSLSQDEVIQHYYSNLKKYTDNSWEFYSNEQNLSDDVYTYYGYADDGVGEANQSQTQTVTIDTTSPYFNSTYSPEDNFSSVVKFQNFNFTVYDALAPTMNCSLVIDDSTVSNFTVSNSTLTTVSTTLAAGVRSWYVLCNDSAGNGNQTATRTIRIIEPEQSSVNKKLKISKEILCPDNELIVTATTSGNTIGGVEVGVGDKSDKTDSDGKVVFKLTEEKQYIITASKAGYSDASNLKVQYTLCKIPKVVECSSNNDCPTNKYCSGDSCLDIKKGVCGIITNHTWIAYQCCFDSDCNGKICDNNVCVQPKLVETTPIVEKVDEPKEAAIETTISKDKKAEQLSPTPEPPKEKGDGFPIYFFIILIAFLGLGLLLVLYKSGRKK